MFDFRKSAVRSAQEKQEAEVPGEANGQNQVTGDSVPSQNTQDYTYDEYDSYSPWE